MKKTILVIGCLLASQMHAGTAGNVSDVKQSFTPFISGEAAATWLSVGSSSMFFDTKPSVSYQRWGGRGAIGMTRAYAEKFRITGEMGWGYFAQTKLRAVGQASDTSITTRINTTTNYYGFDILAGPMYVINAFTVFLKVGAMAENRDYKGTVNAVLVQPGTTTLLTTTMNNLQTNVFPELKVGTLYHVNNNWDATVAYMRVFGNNNMNVSTGGNLAGASSVGDLTANYAVQNPSLNSVMFGLVYNLV